MGGGGSEHLIELLERQGKRREIGVPLDAKLLISVGELSLRKNHKVVIEALQKMPDDYWYVIVGKGEFADELKALDKTRHLRLLGYRTDIVELLHCSDLFVFPSLQEGLPVALMEAMASGLPCVASRIRGNTDLIVDDECLFEAKDSESLMVAINYAEKKKTPLRKKNQANIKAVDRNIINAFMMKIYTGRML